MIGTRAAKIRRKVVRVFVQYVGGSRRLAEEILENERVQHILRETDPDSGLAQFGQAVEVAEATGASPSELVRFADVILPRLVEQLVPVCVSKFEGALEQIQLTHQASAAKVVEAQAQWQQAVVQRLDAT